MDLRARKTSSTSNQKTMPPSPSFQHRYTSVPRHRVGKSTRPISRSFTRQPVSSTASTRSRSREAASSRRVRAWSARSRSTMTPPIIMTCSVNSRIACAASWYAPLASSAWRSRRSTSGIRLWASTSVKRFAMSRRLYQRGGRRNTAGKRGFAKRRVVGGAVGGVVGIHVCVQNLQEFRHNAVAPERGHQAAIHIHGGLGFLSGARQRNPDIGVLALAGAVDHAAHDRDLHRLYARMRGLPVRHPLAQVGLNFVRHLLEEGAGGAPASRAGGDLRREIANAQRLQNLLGDR